MRYLFTFLLTVSAFTSQGQWWYISFEATDTIYQQYFFIDTVADSNNIWQIGTPSKAIFSSTSFGTRAIVTDTVYPCPQNDTSILYLKLPARVWGNLPLVDVQFSYKLNIDTSDICKLEMSRDSGQTWHLFDSLSAFNGDVFHTSSNNWQTFSLYSYYWGFDSSFQQLTDSIFLKFTYINDSSNNNNDGWMIDNFFIEYYYESVNQVHNNSAITLYPNPSSGHIKLTSKTGTLTGNIQVTNLNGQTVYQTNTTSDAEDLYLDLPNGIYILRYSDKITTSVKKLIIQR